MIMSKEEVLELVKELDQKLNLNMDIEFELQRYNAATHTESNAIFEDGKAKGIRVFTGSDYNLVKGEYVLWTDAFMSMLTYPESVEYTLDPNIYLGVPVDEAYKERIREENKDKKIIHVHFRTARWSWRESMGREGHLFIDLLKPEQIFYFLTKMN
jgi:hypothetical protein